MNNFEDCTNEGIKGFCNIYLSPWRQQQNVDHTATSKMAGPLPIINSLLHLTKKQFLLSNRSFLRNNIVYRLFYNLTLFIYILYDFPSDLWRWRHAKVFTKKKKTFSLFFMFFVLNWPWLQVKNGGHHALCLLYLLRMRCVTVSVCWKANSTVLWLWFRARVVPR